ncbi:hypothetical protein AVEN_64323-1 [Araneus ventricosus]|uniref:Uncharacterized protein n=1 Tax=Araneus ventricosus TaxID=182803 RepID=A0A4Y2WAA4_ARAVE|nr:hypothetical protein AVEN_64323-1 [Araneus ventricosus]
MFIWNAAVEELIQFQEPFFIRWLSSTTQYIKRYKTQDREQQHKISTQKKKRERHHGKNQDGSSSATYRKKEKAVDCNRYETKFHLTCWAQKDSVSGRVFNLRCLEQIGNATSDFKVTGIFPFNNNALPGHLFYALADSEAPVPENTTEEEANSSSKVLINTPQINLQPVEPGTSTITYQSPT